MLSLKQPLDDTIEIEGQVYPLDLSFDNVLRWYELIEDESVNEYGKIEFAFRMFIEDCPADDIPFEVKLLTVQGIANYLAGKQDGEESTHESNFDDEDSNTEYFSFDEDAGYIFAAFMKEYGIDLEAQMGILRWEKFSALFNSLSDDTKFMQILSIRATELPTGNDETAKAERVRLVKLKQIYQLKSSQSIIDQEVDSIFNNLLGNAIITKGGQSDG